MPTDAELVTDLATTASGSLGTITASRNATGPYVRTRTTPNDPDTAKQQTVRTLMKEITEAWATTLAPWHHQSWTDYAIAVPLPNRLGQVRIVPPLAHHVRSNLLRGHAGRAMNLTAPRIFNLGHPIRLFNVKAHKNSTTLTFNFDDGADWCNELGSFIGIYASRSQNPNVNFYNGPYELLGTCPDSALEYPVSPFRIDLIEQPTVGWYTFIRVRLNRLDGRSSIAVQYRAPTTLL